MDFRVPPTLRRESALSVENILTRIRSASPAATRTETTMSEPPCGVRCKYAGDAYCHNPDLHPITLGGTPPPGSYGETEILKAKLVRIRNLAEKYWINDNCESLARRIMDLVDS